MKRKTVFLMLLVLFLQFSCTHKKTNKEMEIRNQGVLINYADTRQGDITLLFIHGWGINHTYWNNEVTHFSKKFRVVTIDLPGFGASGKNRSTWTAEDYAADVNAVITGLDLKNVILVGHSMSGSIIVETALTYPDRITGLVGVDNLKAIELTLTPEMEKEWAAFYTNARKNFTATVSADLKNLFAPSTDSLIQQRVTNDILGSDPTVAIASLENLDRYPFVSKLKTLNKPVFLINSNYTPTDTTAFERNGIKYTLLDMGPTGHYPMLENPDKFNTLLEQAIDAIRKE